MGEPKRFPETGPIDLTDMEQYAIRASLAHYLTFLVEIYKNPDEYQKSRLDELCALYVRFNPDYWCAGGVTARNDGMRYEAIRYLLKVWPGRVKGVNR